MNPQQTRRHVLNNSGSKNACRFGKSSRFKQPTLLTHSIYSIEGDLSNRKKGCGFGYGNRTPLEARNQSPSPQKYDLPTTISGKCKTFGSSRQNTVFQSFLDAARKTINKPAPNAYQIPGSINERKISIRERLPTEIQLKIRKNYVPPPNRYHPETAGTPASGKYASSQFKNARKIIFFGRNNSQQKPLNVGPGSYNIGKNYLQMSDSFFRATDRSFGSASRPGPQDRSKRNVPGPGMYQSFSQFPSTSRQ